MKDCLWFCSGKARRGDGNDLTADPKKLAAIGIELDQLSSVINDLTPVSPSLPCPKNNILIKSPRQNEWKFRLHNEMSQWRTAGERDAVQRALQEPQGEEQDGVAGVPAEEEGAARGEQAEVRGAGGGTPWVLLVCSSCLRSAPNGSGFIIIKGGKARARWHTAFFQPSRNMGYASVSIAKIWMNFKINLMISLTSSKKLFTRLHWSHWDMAPASPSPGGLKKRWMPPCTDFAVFSYNSRQDFW